MAIIQLSDGNGTSVQLTPRQAHVVSYLRCGCTLDRVAETMGVDKETIKYHVAQVKNKLGVWTLSDLIEQVAALWVITFGIPLIPAAFRKSDSQLVLDFLNKLGKEVGKEVGKEGGTIAALCAMLYMALEEGWQPISVVITAYADTPTPFVFGTPQPTMTPIPPFYAMENAQNLAMENAQGAMILIGAILFIVLLRHILRFIA